MKHRPGDSRAKLAQQVRAVLAYRLLLERGIKPRQASTWLMAEGYALYFERIEEWNSFFKRDLTGRRTKALANLADELERELWTRAGRQLKDAKADEIVYWLRPKSRQSVR